MMKGLALLAASEVGGALRRRAIATAFFAAAALFVLLAFVFALAALHDWLVLTYPPMIARLMIAGGLAAVALVLGVVGAVKKRGASSRSSQAASAALMAAPVAVGALARLNAGTLLAAGVITAGVLFGRRMARS